ncbi:MAG: sugar ABC transporter permease [Acidimicrobiia bacterium]|nr:sugar ABC transporter permease [Acidimicrobiia bacterium]
MTATARRTKTPDTGPVRHGGAGIGVNKALPYFFSFPAILAVSAMLAFPVLYGIWQSLFRAPELGLEEEYVGVQNYVDMFVSPDFFNSIWRTTQFVVGCLIVGTTLGLFFAFALFRTTGRLRFMRAATLAPYLISNVAAAVMFRIIFNSDIGLVNSMLKTVGVQGPAWLADTTWAMAVVIFAQVWTDLPLTILLLLGGLMTIDRSYLDAALVDGASAWQRARHLTIPLLAPQLVISTVWLSYSTLTGLGVVLALTGGGPLGATSTLPMEMYLVAFRKLEFNQALAIATFILVLNALLTLMYVKVARRYEIEV